MKTHYECIYCSIRTAINSTIYLTSDEELIDRTIKKILLKAAEFKSYENIFEFFYVTQKIIKKIVAEADPYKELKRKYNEICINFDKEARIIIDNAEDKFEAGLRICLAGNSIDVMQGKRIGEDLIKDSVYKAFHQNLDIKSLTLFEKEIQKSKKILFIGDNAGEIVFDKIFIELINKIYNKDGSIAYAVRGEATLNDSTIEDAFMVKMQDVAKVITTGIDMPYAYLPKCSKEFLENYKEADLVISKGQGNLEALLGQRKNIFFLLKIKCNVIAKILNHRHVVDEIAVIKNMKGYKF